MKKDPVVHFEMPYEDHERLSKFYTDTFGWEMNKLGSDMADYVLAGTTETDKNQMVKTPGTINGGFFPKSPEIPPYPSVVISVDDIQETMKKITAAGGKVIGEPQEIPGIGLWVVFTDTEGNRVSAIEPPKGK
jgi:predicted enzyme related to lactoylglutathione lyase